MSLVKKKLFVVVGARSTCMFQARRQLRRPVGLQKVLRLTTRSSKRSASTPGNNILYHRILLIGFKRVLKAQWFPNFLPAAPMRQMSSRTPESSEHLKLVDHTPSVFEPFNRY